jgi:Pyruvate/2-oxoacid:ferredoxin oxidoreductase delta subunit
MIHESAIQWSPSTITGTSFCPDDAIAPFSVKRHGIVSYASCLCANAIRVRQQ